MTTTCQGHSGYMEVGGPVHCVIDMVHSSMLVCPFETINGYLIIEVQLLFQVARSG